MFASVDFLPQIGGVSLATHHIANAFVKDGHSVTVLAPGIESDLSEFGARYELIRDIHARPRNREGSSWKENEFPRLRQLIKQLWSEKEFDRVVAMHPFYYGPALQAVAREQGKPVSVMFHGFELRSQLLKSEQSRSFRAWRSGNGPTLRQLTMKLARSADQIIANSEFTKRQVQRTFTRAPIFVSGCGIDADQARREMQLSNNDILQTRNRIRNDLGVGENEFLVGTLCRLVPHKNVDVMIEAIAKVANARGVIIGDGPEKEKLVSMVSALSLGDRISFRHGESERGKWDLLRALDAFALLTGEGPQGQIEGFGIVILEATAAGVPVIAANSGGIKDVVADEETGLMTPVRNPYAVVEAIRKLDQNRKLGARLVCNAQNKINADFNWRTIARRLYRSWELEFEGTDGKR